MRRIGYYVEYMCLYVMLLMPSPGDTVIFEWIYVPRSHILCFYIFFQVSSTIVSLTYLLIWIFHLQRNEIEILIGLDLLAINFIELLFYVLCTYECVCVLSDFMSCLKTYTMLAHLLLNAETMYEIKSDGKKSINSKKRKHFPASQHFLLLLLLLLQ